MYYIYIEREIIKMQIYIYIMYIMCVYIYTYNIHQNSNLPEEYSSYSKWM